MSARLQTRVKAEPTLSSLPARTDLLQHKYSYSESPSMTGELTECHRKHEVLECHSTNQTATITVSPIVHEVLRSPGQVMDSDTRAFMESRFGHDFSQVRIHTDARAAESALAVNALAYTVGSDIIFGPGQYTPEKTKGKQLLAHELTHVMQQREGTEIRKAEKGGIMSNPASYVIKCQDPKILKDAVKIAVSMIKFAKSQTEKGPRGVPEDYRRLKDPMHYLYTNLFRVEPGTLSVRLFEIISNFRRLNKAFPSASSVKTQCVSNNHPRCKKFDAFATPRDPKGKISFCRRFFTRGDSAENKALLVIHELVHAGLGLPDAVPHHFYLFHCKTTLPTFEKAIVHPDSYVWFAYYLFTNPSKCLEE